MASKRRRRTPPVRVGQSPGTLSIPAGAEPPKLRWTRFDGGRFEVRDPLEPKGLAELARALEGPAAAAGGERHWLEVAGLGDERVLAELERLFQIPRLFLEDVLNSPQRPKVEEYGDALALVLRTPRAPPAAELDQVSIFHRGRLVVTFQENAGGDAFEPVRLRLQEAHSRLRQEGIDYLLYRLVDCAVDRYFPLMEGLADRLEALESEVVRQPSAGPLRSLYEAMHELRLIRRVAMPMRDVALSLGRETGTFFRPELKPFLRDVQDHAAAVLELADHQRDVAADIRELIHGALNLRMNQVMRLLAAVSAIFIPMSFIAGLYGMNFAHMPELEWRYGYFAVLFLLGLIAVASLLLFRRYGWIRLED